MGLGLAALGRPAYVNLGHGHDLGADRSLDAMRARCHAVLDAAWDLGVRYVDAARSYGCSEEFLASWLARRQIRPEQMTVGSKWGYTYTAGWRVDVAVHEVKDHSAAALRRQTAETRSLLGSQLDLYQIHSVTPDSPALADREVLQELARLRDGGLAIGLSVSGPGQADTVKRAIGIELGRQPLFATVQATWNLLEPSAGHALAEAHEAGMGVIVKEALANGRLARRPVSGPLAEVAALVGEAPDAVALSVAIDQPWADVVLCGAASVEQLRSNAAATGVHLSSAQLAKLAGLAEEPEDYWTRRHTLVWT